MVDDSVVADPYPAVFRDNILRSTGYLLERVEACGPVLATAERKQLLHVLLFVLTLPVGWPLAYRLLMLCAPKVEQSGHWMEWIPCLELGIGQSQQQGDRAAEGALRLHLAQFYQLSGDLLAAGRVATAARDCFEVVGDAAQQGVALVQLAILSRLRGEYEQARVQLDRAFTLLPAESVIEAQGLHARASIFLDQQKLLLAADHYRDACRIFELHGETKRAAWSMQGIANALSQLGQYDEAVSFNKQAIEAFTAVKDLVSVAITQMNLGTVYDMLDEPRMAVSCYKLAEPVFRRAGATRRLAILSHNQGRSYRALAEWGQAEQTFLTGIDYWRALGNLEQLVNSLDGLGLVYSDQEKRCKAAVAFKEALAISKQIEDPGEQIFWVQEIMQHLTELGGGAMG